MMNFPVAWTAYACCCNIFLWSVDSTWLPEARELQNHLPTCWSKWRGRFGGNQGLVAISQSQWSNTVVLWEFKSARNAWWIFGEVFLKPLRSLEILSETQNDTRVLALVRFCLWSMNGILAAPLLNGLEDLLEQSQLPVSELSAIYAMSDLAACWKFSLRSLLQKWRMAPKLWSFQWEM